ncbi:flavin reductase [Catellatospora sp. IY07-71]|uniref:flavin reductase n=1 Tax=Catellatospora sp. IY07-71 TaxID=2728827 RepID=UPI001FD4EC6E|nr:flavin reductase [Catellatospora sp. IY07-71]
MTMHLPIRPDWTCAACGLPWPCPSRKGQLLAEYDGAHVSMTLHLSGFFLEACQDIPTAESGVLYSRFLGWRSVPTEMIDVSCE